MTSFRSFCRRHGVTRHEQDQLAWHLATMRARRTYERLRPSTQALVHERGRRAAK